ncbi:MAG: alpha/beta hydrolase [Cyanobacteria bacterium]|nr:alpha/beta hydrolase [Cyanobacteriota bacterium]
MTTFPDFLPQDVNLLTDTMSIAFAQSIERIVIPLTIGSRNFTVDTAFVRSIKAENKSEPPILLLHGFDSSMLEFRRLLPKLAIDRSVFAIDLLGFGFTDRTRIDVITPEIIKAQVYGFWQTVMGRQPMTLVGASMGGAAALDFALTYPELVKQLVLLDSAGFAKAPVLAKYMVPPLSDWATNFLRSPNVRRGVSLRAYADPAFVTADAECCAALHLQMPNWSEGLAMFTRSGGYGFLSDRISEISTPTQIIWGRQDRILGTKDAARFERTIVNSTLYWLDDCGHVPHLEKPEKTARIILKSDPGE